MRVKKHATIDFETRSKVNLKLCGAQVYSEDLSTEVLCLAYRLPGAKKRLWNQGDAEPLDLMDYIESGGDVEAHNAAFEFAIWNNVLAARHGWPPLRLPQLYCSAAAAAAASLPRALGQVGEALGLPITKDLEGHKLMLKMSKPREPTKNNPSIWHDSPEKRQRLGEYCLDDVSSEEAVSAAVRPLSPAERRVYLLDQRINQRGVYVDKGSLESAKALVEEQKAKLIGELQRITRGELKSPTELKTMQLWLDVRGVTLPNMQKATLVEAVKNTEDPVVRRVLKIRLLLGKASTSKLDAMLRTRSKNGRIIGTLLYHGASTGRWTGRLIQPQNYPRGNVKNLYALIDCINMRDLDFLETVYGDPMAAISSSLRGMICAAPGNELTCSDFSAIEARVLAWVAGEKWRLQVFKEDGDIYVSSYSSMFDVPESAVNDDQRQVGKTAELALGYQGGVNAMIQFGADKIMSADQMEEVKNKWRAKSPRIKKFWYAVEQAAIEAVETPGLVTQCGVGCKIRFKMVGKYLYCQLPSGRMLSYYDPQLKISKTPWQTEKLQLSCMVVDSKTKKWIRRKSYGGLLTENVVQAIARDFMVNSMLNLEKAGYKIIMTVHDEIVSENKAGFGSLDDFNNIMSEPPEWGRTMPLAVDGWRGVRYKK